MEPSRPPTVLQAKFSAWLSWSQPFLHALVQGLDAHVRNVVLCERTENLARFPVQHVERIPTRYLIKPSLAVLAADYLERTWAPDVMHAHFGWSGLRLLMLKQILRVPLVVTFGGRDVGLQMQLPDFEALYRILLDASDAIVCVSRDLRDKLVAAGVAADRIQVIYRGTDLSRFAFVDRSGRPADAPVRVLMVGRLVEKKGHRYTLEALAPLVRAGRDVRLTIVGEGEAYHEIRRLRRRLGLGDRVELVGTTDHAGVRRRMAEADLLVHGSVTPPSGDVEGIPNAVVEAQATGLPVIGTVHGGIAEAVRDGETGLLVPERAVEPMRDALDRLVRDRALRLGMGRSARAFVESDFSLARQVEQHVAVYEKVRARAAADPEWRTRAWVPAGYPALVERALLGQGLRHASEFSIAELIERLIWERRIERDLSEEALRDPAASAALIEAAFVPEATRIARREAAAESASAARSAGAPSSPSGLRRARERARAPLRALRRRLARPGDAEGRPRPLERLYNLKALLPQSIKFPLKMALGRALVGAIGWRTRRGGDGDVVARLDARVLAFFREGGDLADWSRAREARRRGAEADRAVG